MTQSTSRPTGEAAEPARSIGRVVRANLSTS
ncbi:MAG: hypothetical protein QOJ47_2321, partial [Gaiellales bacterium]|nr:hypothetical protein [Gaiellales bacterium]